MNSGSERCERVFKIPMYGTAYDMLKIILPYFGFGSAVVEKDPQGAVLFSNHTTWGLPMPDYIARKILERVSELYTVNTIAARAANHKLEFDGRIKASDASCLAMLIEGRDIAKLRKHFGDECVDAIIGRPKDPLRAGQRNVLLQERERLEKEMNKAVQVVREEYSARISALYKEREAAEATAAKAYSEKLAEIKKQLESI